MHAAEGCEEILQFLHFKNKTEPARVQNASRRVVNLRCVWYLGISSEPAASPHL